MVKDFKSEKLSGSYTPEQALQKLLANSNIAYEFVGDDVITLAEAPKEKNSANIPSILKDDNTSVSKETTLKPMTVTAEADNGDNEADSANDPYNRDYAIINASSATKTNTPIMETPISIQVIPKALMNDQQAVRVSDALKNVSGYFDSRGDGMFYDGAFLRGFQVGSRMYIDGIRDMALSRSLSNIERVEVVKGASAGLYGRLEPGGVINHVTKRPLTTPYYSVQQQFGSFDMYRTQIDATGPLTKNGDLAYRINMEYLDSNSFVDFVKKERLFVAPSLTWKLSDRTQLDFDFRYTEMSGHPNFGLPAIGTRPANVPISRFIGDPSDNDERGQYYGGIGLTHEFSDAWKLEAKFAYTHHDSIFNDTSIDSFDEKTGIAQLGYYYSDWKEDSYQGLLNLTGKFAIGKTEHTLATGVDFYQREGEDGADKAFYLSKSMGTSTYPEDINIYNPVYGQSNINMALKEGSYPWYEKEEWSGFYIQDDMKFLDKWHLLFGTRYDVATFKTSFMPNHADAQGLDSSGEFSPRVGLLYQPAQWLSLYANYVRAFNGANDGKLLPGEKRQPQTSESYEAGLKGQWWDGRLTANLAYYELTKSNMTITHSDLSLSNQGYKMQAGEARSKGVEFDMSGKINDNWSLIGTYTYTDTAFIRSNANIQGHQFAGVPEHAGSLWSRYEFAGFGLSGLWSGAGVYVAGQREGDNANSFQLPGFVRVDAALGYSVNMGPSKVTFQFNVDNLLDKQYYSTSGNNGSRTGIMPGAPRTFMGTVRVEF